MFTDDQTRALRDVEIDVDRLISVMASVSTRGGCTRRIVTVKVRPFDGEGEPITEEYTCIDGINYPAMGGVVLAPGLPQFDRLRERQFEALWDAAEHE